MKVLGIVGSGLGEKSMGKAVFNKLVDYSKDKGVDFTYDEVIFTKVKKATLDKHVKEADLIMFITSPFHCALQSGFSQFIMDNLSDGTLKGKRVAGFISSAGLLEKICEAQLRDLLTNLGAEYISGYSAVEYEFLANHQKPADLNVRTGNNIDDMKEWFLSVILAVKMMNTSEKTVAFSEEVVIVTTLKGDDEYRKKAEGIIREKYPKTEVIDLNNLKIADCNACKFCYTEKVCCMKDDMLKVEEKLEKYQTIIHLTDIVNGVLSPAYMKFIQRDVHNGLYPCPEHVGKRVIRVIKSNNFDTSLTKEYLTSLSSFGRQFSSILIDDEIEKFVISDFILSRQQENKAMPNMDGYTKIYTRHFDNLSVMLQNLLKVEHKFYKEHNYCKPSPVNTQAREIHSIEDTRMSQMARLMPVKEFMKEEKKGLSKLWKR